MQKKQDNEKPENIHSLQRPVAKKTTKQYIRARKMLNEYRNARIRVKVYEKKRPAFLKQMKANLCEFEDNGVVDYDKELAGRINKDDLNFLEQYITDRETIWMVEKLFAILRDEKKKVFMEDAVFNGLSDKELQEKYDLAERSVRYRKERMISSLAEMLVLP